MEFGLREYLFILGGVLILGLLVDGVRRTIKHKSDGLKLDLITAPPGSPERTDVSAPRPARKKRAVDLEPDISGDALFESDDSSQLNLWAGEIKSAKMKPAPEESPILAKKSSDLELGLVYDSDTDDEPESDLGFASSDEVVNPNLAGSGDKSNRISSSGFPNECSDSESKQSEDEDGASDLSILIDKPVSAPLERADSPLGLFESTLARLFSGTFKSKKINAGQVSSPERGSAVSSGAHLEETSVDLSEDRAESIKAFADLIVIQICPTMSDAFETIDLHRACLRAGLRFGENAIYQRFPLDQGDIALFSLVNGIEPGTFTGPAKVVSTPLLFVFTELAKQTDPVFAVNELISGARSIAREIGGDVFDTEGNVISKDWIDVARAVAAQQRLIQL